MLLGFGFSICKVGIAQGALCVEAKIDERDSGCLAAAGLLYNSASSS